MNSLNRLIGKSSYKKGGIKERIDNLRSLHVIILPMATKEIKFVPWIQGVRMMDLTNGEVH